MIRSWTARNPLPRSYRTVRYELSEHGGHVGFVFGTPRILKVLAGRATTEWISDSYKSIQEQTNRDA